MFGIRRTKSFSVKTLFVFCFSIFIEDELFNLEEDSPYVMFAFKSIVGHFGSCKCSKAELKSLRSVLVPDLVTRLELSKLAEMGGELFI